MRLRYGRTFTAVSLLVVALPTSARAQTVTFSGSGTATAVVAPLAGCAPLPFQGIASGSGTSSLGAFTYSHTVCTAGATGPVQGTYTINFGPDQFSGVLAGNASATTTPGLFDLLLNYQILSGTGRFSTATGAFTGLGSADVRNGPPSRLSFNFSAVPEPASWALMLFGFGAIGLASRRNTARRSLRQVA